MFDLIDDLYRFATGYFEIISVSSPHIYHSALTAAPQKSVVRNLYESHAHLFTRVVHGVPMSWDASIAAMACPSILTGIAWSPCDRFIAITRYDGRTVDVLDSATLQQLQTLESPQGMPTYFRALVFSPDSRILTCSNSELMDSPDRELFVVSWDLQTGGVSSAIRWWGPTPKAPRTLSITYSADGKMVGVAYSYINYSKGTDIFICDVASGMLVHSHLLNNTFPLSNRIWTHGESLRFATADPTAITIWGVGFTSGATPAEVEILPPPNGFDGESLGAAQLHPTPCRLAFISQGRILVWDARDSRYLLECADAEFHPRMSFSSDGRFFACSTTGSDIYLWTECPTNYVLHGILTFSIVGPIPLLARNGESIVAFGGSTIQLWRTKSFTTPPSSIVTRTHQRTEDFLLEFSPDGIFAVFAMRKENAVTVLNLRSGIPRLTIDARMEVYGLGVIGNAVIVIGYPKVIAWDLPAGDCVLGAWVGLEDSSWTINLGGPRHCYATGASISPDSRHIALSDAGFLYIYSTSTGELLWEESPWGEVPRFSPDGCNIWCADYSGEAGVWRVRGRREGLEPLKPILDIAHPPEGYPWGSSRGYRVTDDWWVLGPDGKRLLMLPPTWQSHPVQRMWKGKFLALLHRGLVEPIILELEVDHSL